MTIDLRSDTVTRPSPAMREAMAAAAVGDDVYGEDPTVGELEARVATLLGHEAGLFTPTGSMANVLGVALTVQPGQELLCDSLAHVVRAEMGAHGALSGITTRTWAGVNGRLDASIPLAMMTPDAGPYLVSTAAIAVENTHNFGGGTVQPLDAIRELSAGAHDAGVSVHLDGARLMNAVVASGVSAAEFGSCADTATLCLSKGLGAPIGSVLVSTHENITAARVLRKRLGGGMRQVGVLAAAGLYALDHNVERLAEDHARARRLAQACAQALPGCVDPAAVETNIVVLDLVGTGLTASEVAARCGESGVVVSVLGPATVRLVTHLDVDDAAVDTAVGVLAESLSAGKGVEARA